MPANQVPLRFGLYDKPPLLTSIIAAIQHLLAIFAAIITAPLVISTALGLSPADTSFMISSSLFVSGLATLIQIRRFGPIGSGLLCIQGTSFSFMGPVIFLADALKDTYPTEQLLAVILGSGAACAIVVMVLSQFLQRLQHIITSTVAATAIILLGATLVIKTLANIAKAAHSGESAFVVYGMAIGVALLISLLASRKNIWLRIASISLGLGIGYIFALGMGLIDFSPLKQLPRFFVPQITKFGIGFDWRVFWSLLPVFLVIATESVGDLTATAKLSGEPISGDRYWVRIKAGVLADAFNSLLAAVFSTFPNTTFSQNNGVIQLTGVTSRYIGLIVAYLLLLLGIFPIVGGLFLVMPKGLLYGATALMFGLVAWAGLKIIIDADGGKRAWIILGVSIAAAYLLSLLPNLLQLPQTLSLLLSFPVVGGTFCAVILELILPKLAATKT